MLTYFVREVETNVFILGEINPRWGQYIQVLVIREKLIREIQKIQEINPRWGRYIQALVLD